MKSPEEIISDVLETFIEPNLKSETCRKEMALSILDTLSQSGYVVFVLPELNDKFFNLDNSADVTQIRTKLVSVL